jgi:hypothetical protein
MPRIAPDLYDQIVWPLTETSGVYRNVGQISPNNSITDLSITNAVIRTGSGLFTGNSLLIPGTTDVPTGSLATRNYVAGAKTVNIAPPITLSFWVYMRSYNTVNNGGLVVKEYRDSDITSAWTTPFVAIGVYLLTTNSGGDWEILIAANATTNITLIVTDFPIPLGVWSHIGITHNGTAIRAYLNGCQCIYYSGATQLNSTAASTLSYTDATNGFGFWRIGAITHTGSANKEEANVNIQDIRIANIARPLSYFKNVYAAGALPLRAGTSVSAQYYKLRAYDTSCVTPTAVVWVDTQISLANAPAFPCSGPYTTPEVLETWYG